MTKFVDFELKQGSMRVPDYDKGKGATKWVSVSVDADGLIGDPVAFKVSAEDKDLIKLLDSRKAVKRVTASAKA